MPDAVITPARTRKSPRVGPFSLMISTRADAVAVIQASAGSLNRLTPAPLMSRLYADPANRISVLGPMMGAPYAASLMETIIAWGAAQILFFGWCGTLTADLHIGDVIVPPAALIDEGTSLHYGGRTGTLAPAQPPATGKLASFFSNLGLPLKKAVPWSTDAPFRETPDKIAWAKEKGASVVDMETSALFTVGAFRGVSISAVLVVSDDLSSSSWKPGFKDPRFRNTRKTLCEGFSRLCQTSIPD